jgi:hypothetical protein
MNPRHPMSSIETRPGILQDGGCRPVYRDDFNAIAASDG